MKRLILLLVIVTLLPSGDLSEQEDSSNEYTQLQWMEQTFDFIPLLLQ